MSESFRTPRVVGLLAMICLLAGLMWPLMPAVRAQDQLAIHDDRVAGREMFDSIPWLDERGSSLRRSKEWIADWREVADMGRVVEHAAAHNGVDSRVLLTLLELWGGAVSAPVAPALTQIVPPTYRRDTQYNTVEALAASVAAAFYDVQGAQRAGLNRGTFAVVTILGGHQRLGDFAQTYRRLFKAEPAFAGGAWLAAGPEPTWRLPWVTSERWWLSGGPHHDSGNSAYRPWSHLDFQPEGGAGCSTSNNNPNSIAAAAAGRVIRSDGNTVVVDHGSGWQTTYFHVRSDSRIANNTDVSVGQRIGAPSCFGGKATGVHVHFSIKRDGQYIEAHGRRLSGWEVVGDGHYQGYLRRNGVVKGVGRVVDAYDQTGTIATGESRSSTLPIGGNSEFTFGLNAAKTVRITMVGSGGLDSYLEVRGADNQVIAFDDDSLGSRNSKIERAFNAGSYTIVARSWRNQSGGPFTLAVQEVAGSTGSGGAISFGESRSDSIESAGQTDSFYFNAVAGRAINLTMTKIDNQLDPFLELYDQNNNLVIADDDSGDGNNARIQYTLAGAGRYRIVARAYRNQSTGRYTLRLDEIAGTNLALGRPVQTSSTEFSSSTGALAVDGNLGTRWSSRFGDPQWIYVNLGATRAVKQVTLFWEAAYARHYQIYVWTGSAWRSVYSTTEGRGGRETIVLPDGISTQYVMMFGTQRGTRYGYSLYEMRVHSVVAPLVPLVGTPDPEDGKDLDDTTPSPAPLPPTDDAKVVAGTEESSAEGEFAQELVPLASSDETGPEPSVAVEGYLPPRVSVQTLQQTLFYSDTDIMYIPALGVDGDTIGLAELADVVWTSDRDGEINQQGRSEMLPENAPNASLAVPASRLSLGVHALTVRVFDHEGAVSEAATITVEIRAQRPRIFLPLLR